MEGKYNERGWSGEGGLVLYATRLETLGKIIQGDFQA
jgi:hypothetical protein